VLREEVEDRATLIIHKEIETVEKVIPIPETRGEVPSRTRSVMFLGAASFLQSRPTDPTIHDLNVMLHLLPGWTSHSPHVNQIDSLAAVEWDPPASTVTDV
jgi:hypothetical protein